MERTVPGGRSCCYLHKKMFCRLESVTFQAQIFADIQLKQRETGTSEDDLQSRDLVINKSKIHPCPQSTDQPGT